MNTVEKVKNSKAKYVLVFVLVVALVLGSLAVAYAAETPLSDEAPGTVITFSGKEWVVLEQMDNGETYILLNDRDCQRAFDPDNTQLFNPNDSNNIAYYLNNSFYNSLSQKELIAEHTWDRVSVNLSGLDSTDKGDVTCKVGLLSYREYERYSKYYNGDILPSSYDYWWWTRTPRTESSLLVWLVTASGDLNNNLVSYSSGSVRPALYLKSGILINSNKEVVGEGTINRPTPPVGVSASAESSNSVDLTWQENTEDDLAGYKVYRDNAKIADVEKRFTSYTDNTALPGTKYTYEITAYNTSNQESAKSSTVTVTVPPGTPTEVTAQATGKEVALSWQGPGNQQFIVERSSDGTNFTQVAEVTEAYFSETAPMWETTYYYRVAQKGQDNRVSAFSEPIQVTTEIVPVPANLKAVLDGNNVNLSWDAVQGVDGYLIEKSIDNETWETLTTVTTNSYTDQVVDPNAGYFYRVRSDGGNEQISEPSSIVTINTPPAAPANLKATTSGKNVSLTWEDSAGAVSYVVQRSSDGTNFSQIDEVAETSYTDTVPDWNTTYHYRVLGKSAEGLSNPSNTVQVKTAPVPPPNLQTAVSHNTVTLTWDSSTGAASYIVQRSMDGGNTWDDIDSTSQTSFEDTGLGWNITFNYRILAKSTDGLVSEPSTAVSVTTDNVPAPADLTASLDGNNVTLTWQPAPCVTLYLIERSTDGQTWDFLIEVGSTTYTDMDMDLNSDFYYRVKSDGGNQLSDPSNVVKVTAPPAAPKNLAASVGNKTVTLTWDGQESVTFIVERSTDGQTWGQVMEVEGKTCQDTVPRWETTYQYRIITKNSDGMLSEPSEIIDAIIPAIPVPTDLTAKVDKNNVSLSWSDIEGIDNYKIERSQNGIIWSDLAEVNATLYLDQDLNWESKYYYRVRAVDGEQISKSSETVTAMTPAPPAPEAPRITYVVDNTDVELSWNHQRSADGYRVYINDSLAAEVDTTNYTFTGERGKSYTIKIEAYNAYGKASSAVNVSISEIPTPGSSTMAKDVVKYTGVTLASTGGLLALGLALKGSPGLVAVLRAIFRV